MLQTNSCFLSDDALPYADRAATSGVKAENKLLQPTIAYLIARQTTTTKSWKFHTFTSSGVEGALVLRKKKRKRPGSQGKVSGVVNGLRIRTAVYHFFALAAVRISFKSARAL